MNRIATRKMSARVIGLTIKTSTHNVRIEMKPTRNEMLLAWMTLIKVRDHYVHDDVLDSMDRIIIVDVLKLLDKLQRMEGNER